MTHDQNYMRINTEVIFIFEKQSQNLYLLVNSRYYKIKNNNCENISINKLRIMRWAHDHFGEHKLTWQPRYWTLIMSCDYASVPLCLQTLRGIVWKGKDNLLEYFQEFFPNVQIDSLELAYNVLLCTKRIYKEF